MSRESCILVVASPHAKCPPHNYPILHLLSPTLTIWPVWNMGCKSNNPTVLAFLLLFFSLVLGQSPIPAEQDGFWFGQKTATSDGTILIEAFFDPVCPDSRDSWPPLKKALQQYGSRVTLVMHTFPLPYHDNAFVTSRALHVVNKLNSSTTYDLLEAFFEHQERFYGKTTFNLSRSAVLDQLVKFVTKSIGNSYNSAIKSGFSDSKTDRATRVSFKYGCLRGVYGTPFFFVNGFPLPDAGSPLDYKGWRQVIDPLIREDRINQEDLVQSF